MRKLRYFIALLHLSIRYFIWCMTRYAMTRTHVPRKVTRCTKLRGAQRSPELALRSTDFHTPENLIFPALSYYFGRCLSELVQLVLRPYSLGESNLYCNGLYNFFITIPRCYKNVYVNSFFPCIARHWNSLPVAYFPLTYDLNGLKSRINWQLLIVGSF